MLDRICGATRAENGVGSEDAEKFIAAGFGAIDERAGLATKTTVFRGAQDWHQLGPGCRR